jgi:hypothetical protein
LAERALEVAETTWDVATQLFGAEGNAEALLDVHLYRDAAAYERADQELTGGQFKANLAFAHWNSLSAHVALQPPLMDAALQIVGLPYLTALLLAHECTHLVRFTSCQNYRSHPDWYANGCADWVEVRVLEQLGFLDETAADPASCAQTGLVLGLIDRDQLPSVADILADTGPELSFFERYAVHGLFFEMLAERHAKKLAGLHAEIRRLGGGSGFDERAAKAFEEAFGSAFSRLDADLVKYVQSLDPQWDEVYRSLETSGEEWVQIAFESKNAVAWRTEPIGGKKFTMTGELTLLPGATTQMNVLLGKSDAGFVQVSFVAGVGITLFDYRDRQWTVLARVGSEAIEVGEPPFFRIAYTDAKHKLSIGIVDGPELELEVPIDLSGPWGLGTLAGSAGIWRKVSLQ